MQLATKRDRLAFLPSMRAALSDVWVPKYRAAVQRELKQHARQAADFARDGVDLGRDAERWTRDLAEAQRPMAVAMAAEGYKLAEVEFGKSGTIDELMAKAALDLSVAFGPESEELLARKLQPDVMAWLESRTKRTVEAELQYMSSVVQASMAEGETVGGIARALQRTMLEQSRWRAERIARSATIWNYNEGAQQFYAESGVGAQGWLVTEDDVLCEFCRPMDGTQIPMDEDFVGAGDVTGDEGGSMTLEWAVEHPPLHPNCRCALVPVI